MLKIRGEILKTYTKRDNTNLGGYFIPAKKITVIFYVKMLLECSDLRLAREWNALRMHNRFAAKLGTGI